MLLKQMNMQEKPKEIIEVGASSLEEEYCLYNKFWYNEQISEAMSGTSPIDIVPAYVRPHRLNIVNDRELEYGIHYKSSRKNKWRKRKLRWWNYKWDNQAIMNTGVRGKVGEGIKPDLIKEFLLKHLPPGTLWKETKSNLYILCPFHNDQTPSMCIGKEKGGKVKCFWCGKSMLLSTLLSQTLGHTRKYWHDLLLGRTKRGNPKHINPNQLEIPFPEDPKNGST